MDWTNIINAALALIVAIITFALIPYIKMRVGESSFAMMQKWVKVAVEAAEMIYTESGLGSKKKEYVEEFLRNLGIKIEYDQLNNLIESAVLELKKGITDESESSK